MKKIVLAILILLLATAGVGGYWYLTQLEEQATEGSPTPAPGEEETPEMGVGPTVEEFMVEGGQYSFTPKILSVSPGVRVRLTFKNVGSVSHTFTIDALDVDTGFVSPGSSKTIEFDVPEEPGTLTYEFHCTVPGHKESGMVGTLTIE